MDAPELWWSASLCEGAWDARAGLITRSRDGGLRAGWMLGRPIEALPDDAVPLVPAEPVDEKGRTPTYQRGHADGRLAQRAEDSGGGQSSTTESG